MLSFTYSVDIGLVSMLVLMIALLKCSSKPTSDTVSSRVTDIVLAEFVHIMYVSF